MVKNSNNIYLISARLTLLSNEYGGGWLRGDEKGEREKKN